MKTISNEESEALDGIVKALKVLMFDHSICHILSMHDPMALKQSKDALNHLLCIKRGMIPTEFDRV